MKHWREAVLVLSFFILFFSGLALASTIIAPYIGLGAKENFLLYQLTGITRFSSLLIGVMGICLGAMGMAVSVIGSKKYSWVQGKWLQYFPVERIEAWIRARKKTFLIYYELPPKNPRNTFVQSDQYFLFFTSLIGITVFLFKPIYFECDAAMYYNYAKFLTFVDGGGFSFINPPAFPAFLALTGQVLFDTFYGTIIAHAIMGALMPLLIYRTLVPISRPVALAIGIAFILSTIPFYAITIMHATQLILFCIILTFYFYARYYFTQDPRFIPLTIIAALLAMFTRWEGLLALVAIVIFIAIIARKKIQHRRLLVLSLVPVLIVIFSWTGARAVHYRDLGLLFSLHSGTGQQYFWRTYQQLGAETEKLETLFGVETNSKKIEAKLAHGEQGIQLVIPENGPETVRLAKIVEEFARDNPESYRNLKEALDVAYQPPSQPTRDFYYEAFGRFDGEPEKLVRNIFASPNMFYPNYIFGALVSKLGISGADQLLQAVAWEAFSHHKLMVLIGIQKAISFYGVNATPIIKAIATKTAPDTNPILVYWGDNADTEETFDIAGCMSKNLSDKMFLELKKDDIHERPELIADAFNTGHLLRNIVRNVAGPIFLLGFWILAFSKYRILFFPIVFTAAALSGVYGMLAAGAYTRYEFPIQPLILLVVGGIVQCVWEWFRQKKQ